MFWDKSIDETTTLEYDNLLYETDKAVLFVLNGEEKWVPKSLIVDISKNEVEVYTWFAEKEQLI